MAAVGDEAPDFALEDEDGRTVHLRELRGSVVVLFFYPADFTPVCTLEAKLFRDSIDEFDAKGAVVLGVSQAFVQIRWSHTRGSRRSIIYLSISCPIPRHHSHGQGQVYRMYGAGRKTFVIDKSGVVIHVVAAALNWRKHVSEALAHC